MELPKVGLSNKELKKLFYELDQEDQNWESGKLFSYVFSSKKKYRNFIEKILLQFYHKSGLDFTVFPSLLKIEKEIIDFAIQHLQGNQECCGNFTSGGTESILLAVKSARDYSLIRNKTNSPEIILPITAHPAFHKAVQYFGLKKRLIPVDKNLQVNLKELENSINQNTILIVGSAPSYTYGVIDPIPEMAKIAKKYNLLFHVDACMGGFLLPFLKKFNISIPDFDFSVDGVTSISMDFHKYAYAPKGSSVVLYKNKEIRKFQIFSCADWVGYTMINPTIQSTKSGGPIAATYCTLLLIGEKGYLNLIKKKLNALKEIQNYIKKHKDLELIAENTFPLLAFTSHTVNIFHIVDEMNSKGWYIQPVLSYGELKEAIHLTITYSNTKNVDIFLKDLEASIETAKSLPSNLFYNKIKPYIEKLKNHQISTKDFLQKIIESVNLRIEDLSRRSASINEVLNLLPVNLREELLTEYVNIILK